MIRNSFCFLERIGLRSEQNLWSQGIYDWSSFIHSQKIKGLSPIRKNFFERQLKKAQKHLFDYDSSFFTDFPTSEVWRLYDYFRDDCLFVDIETTGYYGDISVLGFYDGNQTMTLVKGSSLCKRNIKDIISRYKLLISFNGLSFDIPVIRRAFSLSPNIPHLDLRFALSRLGYDGGLKAIEKILGIQRNSEITGADAVSLWHEAKNGDEDALNLLVQYNEEDIVNLQPLADFAYKNLSSQLKKNFFRRE
ncbi:ribonuclease H-like domain-containing protein [Nanoarchaeota archaeon]